MLKECSDCGSKITVWLGGDPPSVEQIETFRAQEGLCSIFYSQRLGAADQDVIEQIVEPE